MNDVANVNIDAKLIRSNKNKDREGNINTTTDLADTIELANGCACESFSCFTWCRSTSAGCSQVLLARRLLSCAICAGCNIQDELFDSFEQLLKLADTKGIAYDR